jgi:hypothetical protein
MMVRSSQFQSVAAVVVHAKRSLISVIKANETLSLKHH